MKQSLIIGIAVIVVCGRGVAAHEHREVKDVLAKAAQFSNAQEDTFDRDRAVAILTAFLEEHKEQLVPSSRIEIYLELAALNSYRVPRDYRQREKAMHWYRALILCAPDKISHELVIARTNLVYSLYNQEQRLTETVKLCEWFSELLALPPSLFEKRVLWRKENGPTGETRKGEIRSLRTRIEGQRRLLSKAILQSSDSYASLERRVSILMQKYLPGALAYMQIVRVQLAAAQGMQQRAAGKPQAKKGLLVPIDEQDEVGSAIAQAMEHGDAQSEHYDKNKAVATLGEFLQIHQGELDASAKVALLLTLARLHGLQAAEGHKDNKAAAQWYNKAIRVAPGRISGPLIAARVEIPLVQSDPVKAVEKAIDAYNWLKKMQSLDARSLEGRLTWEGGIPPAGAARSKRFRNVRKRMHAEAPAVASTMVELALGCESPVGELSKIAVTYLPGVLACEAAIKFHLSSSVADSKKDSTDAKMILRTVESWRKSGSQYMAPALFDLTNRLNNRERLMSRYGQDVLVCDLAVCALEEIVYGALDYERTFYRLPRDERDAVIERWGKWWNDNKSLYTRGFPDYAAAITADRQRDIMESVIRQLTEGKNIEGNTAALRKYTGTDFAYQVRTEILQEPRDKVVAEIVQKWRVIEQEPPRDWPKLTREEARRHRLLADKHQQEIQVFRTRKHIEEIRNPFPEVWRFTEELWPKWRKSPEGKQKALHWLNEHREAYMKSPGSSRLETVREQLQKEQVKNEVR